MEEKKFWNFIILALFGGIIGLQEFYMGRTFLGILAVLFWWTSIPAIVAYIEAVVWLFRGEKRFNQKFNAPKINVLFFSENDYDDSQLFSHF